MTRADRQIERQLMKLRSDVREKIFRLAYWLTGGGMGQWHWVVDDPTLTAHEKLTALALIRRQNGDAESWPSQQRLKLDTALSITSIRDALRGLQDKGFLRIKRRGSMRSNSYVIRCHQNSLLAPQYKPKVIANRRRSCSPTGGDHDHQRAAIEVRSLEDRTTTPLPPVGDFYSVLVEICKSIPAESCRDSRLFSSAVQGSLTKRGCTFVSEYKIADRGDGYPGFIDLVVTSPLRCALELDRITPRKKSIFKIRQFGQGFVLLREGETRVVRIGEEAERHKQPHGPETQVFNWCFETIAVEVAPYRKLPSLECMTGSRAGELVQYLNRKGFAARIVHGAA